MAVYYNEIEPYAAEWLRNLMKEGLIPDGEVDTRSIVDVRPSDLRGFKQCHFFAGIAGWSHALRIAGWADDREIWTGSCPCQPFSVAGKGKGTADERHLWPVFFDLIAECRPAVVMGEQVASKAGRDWFGGVRSDLETVGYAVGGADLCAAGVGAPHIRQRLWWVGLANADSEQLRGRHAGEPSRAAGGDAAETWERQRAWPDAGADGDNQRRDLGHADDARLQGHGRSVEQHDAAGWQEPDGCAATAGVGDMAYADGWGQSELGERNCDPEQSRQQASRGNNFGGCDTSFDVADANQPFSGERREQRGGKFLRSGGDQETRAGFWDDAVWLTGADGKARRAKSGLSLLAHGVPARVGKLRAFGNAIVPPLAAEVIRAFMEAVD